MATSNQSAPAAHGDAAAVVHLFHHTFGRGGGAERYALDLIRGLAAAERRVVFHCRKADAELAREMGVEVRLHAVPSFPRKLRDYRFFRRMEREAAGLSGCQISLTRLKARDAVICGGTHRGYLAKAGKFTGPFDLLQIWMEAAAYRAARRVISHSHLCARELAELYRLPPEKIVTIHPPVDATFAPPAGAEFKAACRRQLGLPADQVVFLFPSLGHKRKGLGPVRAAMREFGGRVVLAVAGKPPRGMTAPFVRDLGYLKDMTVAYAAADFTILGSYYEPFGLVGVESVMCGTPLVFEENAGCLEVIKPDAAIKFSVRDPSSIRRAIAQALELAASGRQHLADPHAQLTYNPSVAAHVAALLAQLEAK